MTGNRSQFKIIQPQSRYGGWAPFLTLVLLGRVLVVTKGVQQFQAIQPAVVVVIVHQEELRLRVIYL